MPKRLEITLSEQQRAELLQARDHHSKAYVREKAAAILKIADERLPALQVASHRLLKRRDDNTVRSWLRHYLQGGLAGLLVQKGRGKKPAFSPSGRPKRRKFGARGGAAHPSALRPGSPWLDTRWSTPSHPLDGKVDEGLDQQTAAALPARLQAWTRPCAFPRFGVQPEDGRHCCGAGRSPASSHRGGFPLRG